MATTTAVAERCDPQPQPRTAFGRLVPYDHPIVAHGTFKISERDVRYLRLRIKVHDEAPDDWAIYITDQYGRPLQSFDQRSSTGRTFWTDRFKQTNINVSGTSASAGKELGLVSAYVAMPASAEATYYSTKIKGKSDWLPLYPRAGLMEAYAPDYQRRFGSSIGMLIATYNAGSNIGWTCSGFALKYKGRDWFVTANHCGSPVNVPGLAWHDSIRVGMFIDFSWDNDDVSREYIVAGNAISDPKKDLAILPISPLQRDASPPSLKLGARAEPLPDKLFAIHHPASDKKVASTCSPHDLITREGVQLILHDCDMEAGSSGAPLMDGDGVVWGIHVAGHEKNAAGVCDSVNKAVSVIELKALIDREVR